MTGSVGINLIKALRKKGSDPTAPSPCRCPTRLRRPLPRPQDTFRRPHRQSIDRKILLYALEFLAEYNVFAFFPSASVTVRNDSVSMNVSLAFSVSFFSNSGCNCIQVYAIRFPSGDHTTPKAPAVAGNSA